MHIKYKFAILVFILFVATIGFFIQTDKTIQESETNRLQSEIVIFAQTLIPYYLNGNLDVVYKLSENFHYQEIEQVPKNAEILYESFNGMLHFKIFTYDSFIGFTIAFLDDSINFVTLKDNNAWNNYKILILLFQLGIIALLAFFLFHQVLHPINKLRNAIDELKSGIYRKMLTIKQNDEIGLLMQTFNEMNEKISRMIKARELITRNIAHEIKTPLAKIKLALSLKEGIELKKDLERYVDSLHRISQNMLEYERIQESDFKPQQDEFLSESVLFEALKDIEENKISLNIIKSIKIKGDFHLLTIAIKNLIENAIKYSDDGVVNIELSEMGIVFCNSGKKLEHNISYYFEPFYRGDISKSGYGLGLSIVNEIVALHKMHIEYQYSDGKHIFYLRF